MSCPFDLSFDHTNIPIPNYDHDSTPSLGYSDDFGEEYTLTRSPSNLPTPNFQFEKTMSTHKEDINDVLDDVLVKTARIVDHLRDRGQNEAANRVSRDMTNTFRYLYDTIASYKAEDCIMKPPKTEQFPPADSSHTPQQLPKGPTGNTWAAIAATEPAHGNRLIKYRPSDSIKQEIIEQELGQPENKAQDSRVVWIQPWREGRPLNVITNSIKQLGAIYSIAFAPAEQSVCIIFRHAYCAVHFMTDHADFVAQQGCSRFGHGISVLPGHAFPMNDDLRLMDHPHNERRRLTFARQQLFSHGVTEMKFKADLEAIVGSANVELVWLFNTGNATVVFSAVPLARLAKDKFGEYSKQSKSPYEGVMVSFSHDPCERDMHLVTQISDQYMNGYSRSTRAKRSNSRRQSNASTGVAVQHHFGPKYRPDSDGWQTVSKRR